MWRSLVKGFHRWSSPKWFYQISQPWSFWLGCLGALISLIAIVWGLGFAPEERLQGNSYRIIFIHVPSAFLSQAIYIGIAVAGAIGLIWRIKLAFYVAKAAIGLGISMAFVALVTGAIWGKPTWGQWWVWDMRITSMLILLLLYVGLWALHNAIEHSASADKAAAILALVGVVNIPVIKFSVNLVTTLHQPATLKLTEKAPMHISMLIPLLLSILGFYLSFLALLFIRTRLEILHRETKAAWAQQEIAQLVYGVVKSQGKGE
ncbi:heme ABC transporter permease [Reinekea thalattae]|uniref:Heme exporter protein C n=1 Tax=Reinekea thalattae TaxID=2593301 RepID=A0A5C8ZA83_9GAMM|nr:heme ABC transporter permease [Reinekea thalattae]